MFRAWVNVCVRCVIFLALLGLAVTCAASQDQKLPDAPAPQNNAPLPTANPPQPGMPDDQGSSSSKANPEQPAKTRNEEQPPEGSPSPTSPPPGSEVIKTIPPGSAPNTPSPRDELFSLVVHVNFIVVPVTVKDSEGKLVDGLLQNDFSVYENGTKQQIRFFTSDPMPLSAAVIIDLNLPETLLKRIGQTFASLGGAFGPFDEVSLFTYGNSVSKQQDFGNTNRLDLALNRVRDMSGERAGPQVVGGPFGSGPTYNGGIQVDPARLQVQTPARESYVLNDAILMAAQELAHRPAVNRKIIFVISDGKEYGSRANYQQVLKVLLTNQVAVYAIGVDSAAMPIVSKVEKARIPGFGYSDILPKYANATGGDVLSEFTKENIERAYGQITLEARNQYTLGYNTPQTVSSTYRDIEVRVKRPGLNVYAKHGYYPLPPQRSAPELQPDQSKAATPAPSAPQPPK